jgi:release factor glutamine methyltransferase
MDAGQSDSPETGCLTIATALREGRMKLANTGTDTPSLDAEVLLRHVLGIDRTKLFSMLQESVTPQALASFRRLVAARAAGTPVAYLTEQREFMGHSFIVSPWVLVPRPETEILVEWAIQWLRERERATVVDVGTGSGAIALSLALAMGSDWPGAIIASDVSPEAIHIAGQNRDRFGLKSQVRLRRASLLDRVDEPVDLLLANLPYLRPEQINSNPELAAEPRLALDGGNDGLDLIRALLDDAPRVVAPGGAVGLEIDPDQSVAVAALARRAFPESEIEVLNDLAGFDRHVTIQTASR